MNAEIQSGKIQNNKHFAFSSIQFHVFQDKWAWILNTSVILKCSIPYFFTYPGWAGDQFFYALFLIKCRYFSAWENCHVLSGHFFRKSAYMISLHILRDYIFYIEIHKKSCFNEQNKLKKVNRNFLKFKKTQMFTRLIYLILMHFKVV